MSLDPDDTNCYHGKLPGSNPGETARPAQREAIRVSRAERDRTQIEFLVAVRDRLIAEKEAAETRVNEYESKLSTLTEVVEDAIGTLTGTNPSRTHAARILRAALPDTDG
jgi:hypothetical protein